MGKFEVYLKPSAVKDLKRIDKIFHELIKRKILSLELNPLPNDVKKLAGHKSLYRVRQGKFRIVYSIDFTSKSVKVVAVEHRHSAYNDLQN